MGFLKVPVPYVSYELDSKMIMNGKYDLEGFGYSLCEGAALPFWLV
jgi:hypothetical protein